MASESRDSEILNIIQKYNKEEILLDELLKDKEQQDNKIEDAIENHFQLDITSDEATKRNQELLKDFELVKARLRSQAIFCPTEIQWDEICQRYQQSPSLPVTTWRCHLPAFV